MSPLGRGSKGRAARVRKAARRAAAKPRGRAGGRGRASSAGLDRLWSPWRMEYIRTAEEPAGCLFCRVAASVEDRKNLVLARGEHTILMLNRYPYNPAHLMAATYSHKASFAELSVEERDELMALTALAEAAIQAEYQPHGMNVGANLGRVAGAGFPGHLHLHLVPRWNGDTNFMPVIGATRVLPESLARTWSRVRGSITRILKAAAEAEQEAARAEEGRVPSKRPARGRSRSAGARSKAAGRRRRG